MNNNIERLAAAGIIQASHVTHDERGVIDQLTADEVTVLIEVATRLSPGDPTALKVFNFKTGKLRICFPL